MIWERFGFRSGSESHLCSFLVCVHVVFISSLCFSVNVEMLAVLEWGGGKGHGGKVFSTWGHKSPHIGGVKLRLACGSSADSTPCPHPPSGTQ